MSVFLLSVVFSVPFVSLVEGNPIYTPGDLIVAIIESPHSKTYTTNTIPLAITTGDHQFPSTGYYSVDGGPETKINENGRTSTYKTTLHLLDGKHTIHVRTESVGSACADLSFDINTKLSFITLKSPENKVYNRSTVPLEFTIVDESVYQIKYHLDDQKENVTVRVIEPDPTHFNEDLFKYNIGNLTNGRHNLVVYATDDLINTFSDSISFEVNAPLATHQESPTATVSLVDAALVAIVFVIIACLLVYTVLRILRRKRQNGS